MNAMTFHDTTFEIVDIHGQPWLRSREIGLALGYASANKIGDIYRRHHAEFTPEMTSVVDLPTNGGPQKTRIFSLRGARMIAIHSTTEKAAAFRAWILDLIEAHDAERSGLLDAAQAEVLRLHPRYGRLRQLLAYGLTRKEMAGALGVSTSTVHHDLERLAACGLLTPQRLLEAPRHG